MFAVHFIDVHIVVYAWKSVVMVGLKVKEYFLDYGVVIVIIII